MLQSLTIKNIALIDELTIELGNGFNVLTGEIKVMKLNEVKNDY